MKEKAYLGSKGLSKGYCSRDKSLFGHGGDPRCPNHFLDRIMWINTKPWKILKQVLVDDNALMKRIYNSQEKNMHEAQKTHKGYTSLILKSTYNSLSQKQIALNWLCIEKHKTNHVRKS